MPRKMPRGQRPIARRTIPARQTPPASATTETPNVGEQVAAATRAPYGRRPQAQPTTPARGPVDFAKEYHYVGDELKQTGLFAGCIFAGLIILSFIIR